MSWSSYTDIYAQRDPLPLKKIYFPKKQSRLETSRLWVCEPTRQTVSPSHCSKERLKSVSVQRRQSGLKHRGTRHRFMCDTRTSSCVRVLWILTHLFPASPVQLSACVSVSVSVWTFPWWQLIEFKSNLFKLKRHVKVNLSSRAILRQSKELKETEGGRDES